MKTLIVQNYWTPYRSDLFEALSKIADIEVLYLGAIGPDRKWKMENTTFSYLTVPSRKFGPFTFSSLEEIDFSLYGQVVVIEHLENLFSILKIVRKFKGRYFLWSGMFDDMYPDKPLYGKLVERIKKLYRPFLYRAKGYFAYSSLTRNMFLGNGISPGKIEVIKQASRIMLLLEIESSPPEELRISCHGPLRVLSLGYLRREKNNEFLVHVCKQFSKDELVLTIVGDGPEKERLKGLSPENVVFKDYLQGEIKFREYLEADIFVLPTIRDPWALTVNEAMAYGLPVICSNRAGAKDLISDNGFVIDPYNGEELYNALNTFVRDRGLVRIMGKRSREIIADYSIEKSVEQIANIILNKDRMDV